MQLPAQMIFCKMIIYWLLFNKVKHSAFKKKVEFWPQSFICLQFIWNILVRDNFTTIHQKEETEIYALLSWKNEYKKPFNLVAVWRMQGRFEIISIFKFFSCLGLRCICQTWIWMKLCMFGQVWTVLSMDSFHHSISMTVSSQTIREGIY